MSELKHKQNKTYKTIPTSSQLAQGVAIKESKLLNTVIYVSMFNVISISLVSLVVTAFPALLGDSRLIFP